MKKELLIAKKAAAVGAAILIKNYEKKFKIRKKGEINLVTEIDEKAQAAIVKVIKKAFPDDAILAEEGDLSKTQAAPRRWIIDPLDGTTNFAHGYPRFCVSIAFEEKGKVKVGVIHDPCLKEIFTAVKSKGAFVNGRRLKVTGKKLLRDSLLVTGFPYDLQKDETNNLPYFCHMLFHARAVRRDGSAALNLAYVAAGRFDAFWELGVKPWDVAAGLLLIREAGGVILPIEGEETQAENPAHLIAGQKDNVHSVFTELQKTHDPEASAGWRKLL